MKKWAGLFDLDGVVFDTEGLYTGFWENQGKAFVPDVADFAATVKGHTINEIFEQYFPDQRDREKVTELLKEFEARMPFDYVPGAKELLTELKGKGVKLAIVTSSNNAKMANVYKKHPYIKEVFDAIITADKITHSKPDPECYLLAASELGAGVEECVVFEDSFAGLRSGRNAGMKVVGLATTNPADTIRELADVVIPDFTNFTFEHIKALIRE